MALLVMGNKTKGLHYWSDIKNGCLCGVKFILEDNLEDRVSSDTNLATVNCQDCIELVMNTATEILKRGAKSNGYR